MISIPLEAIDRQSAFCLCVTVRGKSHFSRGSWSWVFECRAHHPVINMHTLAKSLFDEEANALPAEGQQRIC